MVLARVSSFSDSCKQLFEGLQWNLRTGLSRLLHQRPGVERDQAGLLWIDRELACGSHRMTIRHTERGVVERSPMIADPVAGECFQEGDEGPLVVLVEANVADARPQVSVRR